MKWSIEFVGLNQKLDTKVDPQGKSVPFEIECFETNPLEFINGWKELWEESNDK